MSDANRTAIRVSREQSFKLPFNNPLFQPIRITSAGLSFTPETVTSNELDPTRSINDQPLVGFSSGGDVPAELSVGNMDPLIEGLMLNPWLRTPEIQNGASWKYGAGSAAVNRITAIAAASITVVAGSVLVGSQTNGATTNITAGQLIYLSGLGAVADQILRATASTATAITVAGATPVPAPPALARLKVIGFEGIAGDIAAVTVGGTALTSTALNFTTMNLTVGQWVFLASPSTYGFAAFSGFARVSAIAAGRLSFDNVPTGFIADAGAGKTIRVFYTDSIRNGVQEDISFYIEEEFGLGQLTRYLYYRGQEVNSRVISGESKAIITDTLNFMGADALPVTAARQAGATSLAISTGTVLNSSTAIPLFYENGAPVVGPNYVNAFSISIENGKRSRDAVGTIGAVDLGTGRCNVTGTMSTYFGNEVLYNKVISNTVSSLTVAFADPANMRAEIQDIPKLKYSSGAPDVTGIDTDIMVPLAFQGLREFGRDYMIMYSRFEYYL